MRIPANRSRFTNFESSRVTCSCLGWDPNQHCEDFSVGEPNANCEIKLMNPEDLKTEVPDGERGEIWIKAPNVMKGYWKNEKATKETITPDGWLRSGDIAYKDENGRFFIVDRMKVGYQTTGTMSNADRRRL